MTTLNSTLKQDAKFNVDARQQPSSAVVLNWTCWLDEDFVPGKFEHIEDF